MGTVFYKIQNSIKTAAEKAVGYKAISRKTRYETDIRSVVCPLTSLV